MKHIVLGILLWFIVLFLGLNIFVLNQGISYVSDKPAISDQVIAYLQGVDDLPELSYRETVHMQDVKKIIENLFLILVTISIVAIGWSIKQKKEFLSKSAQVTEYIGYAVVLLGIVSSFFFAKAFVIFHSILFTNDYWLLPYESILIQTYPESFFLVVTLGILLYILLISLAIRWWRLCKLPMKKQANKIQ